MNPLLFNTFFRSHDGLAEVTATIGGYVNIRILGSERTRDFLRVGESFVVELEGVKAADGSYANALTLTATILDSDGTELISPQSMVYVTGSHGTYRYTMPNSLAIVADGRYRVVVDGDAYRVRPMMAS